MIWLFGILASLLPVLQVECWGFVEPGKLASAADHDETTDPQPSKETASLDDAAEQDIRISAEEKDAERSALVKLIGHKDAEYAASLSQVNEERIAEHAALVKRAAEKDAEHKAFVQKKEAEHAALVKLIEDKLSASAPAKGTLDLSRHEDPTAVHQMDAGGDFKSATPQQRRYVYATQATVNPSGEVEIPDPLSTPQTWVRAEVGTDGMPKKVEASEDTMAEPVVRHANLMPLALQALSTMKVATPHTAMEQVGLLVNASAAALQTPAEADTSSAGTARHVTTAVRHGVAGSVKSSSVSQILPIRGDGSNEVSRTMGIAVAVLCTAIIVAAGCACRAGCSKWTWRDSYFARTVNSVFASSESSSDGTGQPRPASMLDGLSSVDFPGDQDRSAQALLQKIYERRNPMSASYAIGAASAPSANVQSLRS